MTRQISQIKHYLLATVLLFFLSFKLGSSVVAANNDKFVVVIDAGHGGKDYGAMDNGVNEKDINLGVALKLGEMIQKKLKNTEVVYTRKGDTFVSLQGRADIANKAKGNLFISIHTNSVTEENPNRKTVEGVSTYILGLHKDNDNLAVAQRENSVMQLEGDSEGTYKGFDPNSNESYIVFEMAQKKNLANSIKFAGEVQREMAMSGRKDRGVHQAGFWVLWSTSMPSALIELDFICNPEQAKFLSSSNGQEKLAKSIFNAVKTYKEYYDKSLKSHVSNTTSTVEGYRDEDRERYLAQIKAESEGKTAEVEFDEKNANLLESSVPDEVKKHRSETSSTSTDSKRHRRRSAREKGSSGNQIENAVIIISSEEQQLASNKTEVVKEDEVTQPVNEEKTRKKKEKRGKNETRTYQNKTVTVNDTASGDNKPARRDRSESSYKTRRQHAKEVYKIRLFFSEEIYKESDPIFKGLSPITLVNAKNGYDYTFGESNNRLDMDMQLENIKKLFPNATVKKYTL